LTSPAVLVAQVFPSIILCHLDIFRPSHVNASCWSLVNAGLSRVSHWNDVMDDEPELVTQHRNRSFGPDAGGQQIPTPVVPVKTQHVRLTVHFKSQLLLQFRGVRLSLKKPSAISRQLSVKPSALRTSPFPPRQRGALHAPPP
jgi:hypothetical protein